MDNGSAFKLMEGEVGAVNARQDAHDAQTGKALADLIVESREWLKAEAERREKADAAEAEVRAKAYAEEAEMRAAADAAEAERRAEVDREVMREWRQTAVNVALGLAGLIVVGFLGLAGLILRISQAAVSGVG